MFQSIGNPSKAYGIAVPDSNAAFLDSWASGYARSPALGPGWDTTGIGITSSKPPVPFYAGTGNTQATLDAGPRSSALARVNIADQVLTVSVGATTPFGRLRDAAGSTYSLASGSVLRLRPGLHLPRGKRGLRGSATDDRGGRGMGGAVRQ